MMEDLFFLKYLWFDFPMLILQLQHLLFFATLYGHNSLLFFIELSLLHALTEEKNNQLDFDIYEIKWKKVVILWSPYSELNKADKQLNTTSTTRQWQHVNHSTVQYINQG